MADHNLEEFLRRLARTLMNDTRSDGELLAAFALDRNEDAFSTLVGRHAKTVWAICCNVLSDPVDAEDAFQATFMALASSATTLIGRDRLDPWLRVTARNLACKLYRTAVRQGRRLQVAAEAAERNTAPVEKPDWSALQEEFQALPDEFQAVLTLHYLEGQTCAEVGNRLGLSAATAQRRIAQAAEMLRSRLRARGIASTAGGFGAILLAGSVQAMPTDLIQKTVGLAAKFTRGDAPPSSASALALSAVGSKSRLWVVGAVVMLLAGVVGAITLARPQQPVANPDAERRPVPTVVAPINPPPLAVLKGMVRDEAGKPVAGAKVTALAHFSRFGQVGIRDEVLGTIATDSEGKFSLPVPSFPTSVAETRRVKLLVTAPGGKSNTESVAIPAAGDPRALELRVVASRIVRGVVVDSDGVPVAGAIIRLTAGGNVCIVPLAGETRSEVTGWPDAVRSDAQGRFELKGVPAGKTRIAIEHSELAFQEFPIAEPVAAELRFQLGKARVLSGRVIAADTQAPVPLAIISAVSVGPGDAVYGRNVRTEADGSFRFAAPAGQKIQLRFHPPSDSPLLAIAYDFEWPADQTNKQWDATLPRGVRVRGRVTDVETGAAIPDALISFNPTDKMADPKKDAGRILVGASALVATDKDGRFEIAVPRVKGKLFVDGPSLAYVSELTGTLTTSFGGMIRAARSVNATAIVDASNVVPKEVILSMQRGSSLLGNAVLSDGSPVKLGAVVCRHLTNSRELLRPVALPIRDGRFEIPGCRPDCEYHVLLMTADFKYGAVATLKCTEDKHTVVLNPTSQCKLDLQTPTDSPQAGAKVLLTITMEPEGPKKTESSRLRTEVPASHAFSEMHSLFPGTPPGDWLTTDENGQAAFEGLIPGATYHLWLPSPNGGWVGMKFQATSQVKRITAKPTGAVPDN